MENTPKTKRIFFAGPSGTGKTTLAKFIAEELDLPYLRGSAGHIMSDSVKANLFNQYGWESKGHQNVITMGHQNPAFGKRFQDETLKARVNMIRNKSHFVTDRSFLDLIIYYSQQIAQHLGDDTTGTFVYNCLEFLNKYTDVLIYVDFKNPASVENNGSRISNRVYQKSMSYIFKGVLEDLKQDKEFSRVKVLVIDYWDLEKRKQNTLEFLSNLGYY